MAPCWPSTARSAAAPAPPSRSARIAWCRCSRCHRGICRRQISGSHNTDRRLRPWVRIFAGANSGMTALNGLPASVLRIEAWCRRSGLRGPPSRAAARRREPGRRAPASCSMTCASAAMRSRNIDWPANAPGSMAIRNCPTPGGLPSASKNELASNPKLAPVMRHGQHFHHQRQGRALGAADRQQGAFQRRRGDRWSACRRHRRPSQAGWARPSARRSRILPRATWLSARSTTTGACPRCGAAKPIGLVP